MLAETDIIALKGGTESELNSNLSIFPVNTIKIDKKGLIAYDGAYVIHRNKFLPHTKNWLISVVCIKLTPF